METEGKYCIIQAWGLICVVIVKLLLQTTSRCLCANFTDKKKPNKTLREKQKDCCHFLGFLDWWNCCCDKNKLQIWRDITTKKRSKCNNAIRKSFSPTRPWLVFVSCSLHSSCKTCSRVFSSGVRGGSVVCFLVLFLLFFLLSLYRKGCLLPFDVLP